MTKFNTKSFLEKNGFTEYKKELRLRDFNTTFVYLIKGVKEVLIHTSGNPLYYLKKHSVWLNQGKVSKLPKAVGIRIKAEFVQDPEAVVTLYYKQKDPDWRETKEILTKEAGLINYKDTRSERLVNVVEVRAMTDQDYYRIIHYDNSVPETQVLSKFTSHAKDRRKISTQSVNKEYTNWCIRNKHAIATQNFIIHDVADEVTVAEAQELLTEYLKEVKGVSLNVSYPLLHKKQGDL